jgi:hypothetical protein
MFENKNLNILSTIILNNLQNYNSMAVILHNAGYGDEYYISLLTMLSDEIDNVQAEFINKNPIDCDNLHPGFLAHAGNPNPRSALMIDRYDNVYFINVKGRKYDAYGMDLVQLAKICQNLGAVQAINLDGGGSSQMIWKDPNKNVIEMCDPRDAVTYPIGSIISYVFE